MAINRIELKDFLVFKGEFTSDFCSGVNVFIGGNGTGKTTLLRAMYAVQERSGNINDFNHFVGYFRGPFLKEEGDKIYDSIQKVLLTHSDGKIYGYLSNNDNIRRYLSNSEKRIAYNIDDEDDGEKRIFVNIGEFDIKERGGIFQSVYIPEKDLLSNSRKLPESVEYGNLQFTRCEIDLIKKSRVAAQKPLQPLVKKIHEIIGGVVTNDGEDFYVKRDGIETPIPFSMEASGYRKFGLLATLIRNEQIKSGATLFWDEPENSLNPELIPVLVNILLELSRNDVQIFIATHSELLASYFSVNQQQGDNVMFFSLYKDEQGQIKADANSRFDLLYQNKLTEEPVKLYKKQIEKGLGNG